MKRIGCKSFINEIDELELGQAPGAALKAHLQLCASCRTFYDDRLKLRQMVSDLETVEAPGDFGFRLRARLANEPRKSASPFTVAGFGFGLPTIALAIIALLVGVALYTRFMTESEIQRPLAKTVSAPISAGILTTSSGPAVKETTPSTIRSDEARQAPKTEIVATTLQDQRRNRRANLSISGNVRRDDFLAKSETTPVFPLESTEPLRVSVDYATGGSRTISVPAVSFGSQQVVARGASMVKTSARTVW